MTGSYGLNFFGESMYDFSKFKAAAFKYKYDIVFENEKTRVTYNELYTKVNALYNSLVNMGVAGCGAVFAKNPQDAIAILLALSKAGIKRVIADSRLPVLFARELADKYNPSVVFVEKDELVRLAPVFLEKGVKTAVVFGRADSVFPAQFEFDDLIERNDYVYTGEYQPIADIEFYQQTSAQISSFDEKNVSVDIPVFCKAGAKAYSELLYSGGKCMLFEEKTAKNHKKRKTELVITDKDKHKFYDGFACEVRELCFDARRVDESFFEREKISKLLSDISGASVDVSFNGAVFVVTALYPKDVQVDLEGENVKALRNAALDLLYPFDKKKTITIKRAVI